MSRGCTNIKGRAMRRKIELTKTGMYTDGEAVGGWALAGAARQGASPNRPPKRFAQKVLQRAKKEAHPVHEKGGLLSLAYGCTERESAERKRAQVKPRMSILARLVGFVKRKLSEARPLPLGYRIAALSRSATEARRA